MLVREVFRNRPSCNRSFLNDTTFVRIYEPFRLFHLYILLHFHPFTLDPPTTTSPDIALEILPIHTKPLLGPFGAGLRLILLILQPPFNILLFLVINVFLRIFLLCVIGSLLLLPSDGVYFRSRLTAVRFVVGLLGFCVAV